MLHPNTVSPRALELLRGFMADSFFSPYVLAGGTALALQIGHRQSYDLDFFTSNTIQHEDVKAAISGLANFKAVHETPSILVVDVEGIKVDFVRYRYPWITQVNEIEGLRLAALPDIGAMKLAAIAGRGKRRDFNDLFFLLKHYSLQEIIDFYERKYPDGNALMVIRSLTYFEDADGDPEISYIGNSIGWMDVKHTLRLAVTSLLQP